MNPITVYLEPHSTFYGRDLPRSDTLFGAICWGWRLLFGTSSLETILESFHDERVPFLLSSMFGYTETEQGRTHYFPKPLSDPFHPEELEKNFPKPDMLEAMKMLKERRTVYDEDFRRILHGEKGDREFYEEMLQGEFIEKTGQEWRKQDVVVPHSSINRLTWTVDAEQVFYSHEVTLTTGRDGLKTGVFFCVKCQEALVKDLKTVLYFLADKGIGGGISIGKGQFTMIEVLEDLPYREPPDEESDHVVTLSLTYPDTKLQKVLLKSWYTLERRQGKLESMYVSPEPGHIRKDQLLMLQEGSTFPKNGRLFYGANPIVRRAGQGVSFDVRHYGYAFTVNTQHVKL